MYQRIIALVIVVSTTLSCQQTATNCKHIDSVEKLVQRRESERSDNEKIEQRIDELISKMTVQEKVGQMIQLAVDVFSDIKEYNQTASGITEITLDSAKFLSLISQFPIGSVINGYGFTPENWCDFETQMQQLVQKHTIQQIPIIHSADHQHGANYVHGATLFPHSLNMAATFNTKLIESEAEVLSIETAYLGHRWILGPLCDVGVNPRWPRIYETYGEDTYLTSEMVKAYLRGAKNAGSKIQPYAQVHCAKHFVGYSNPTGAWDRTPADFSKQTLYEYHLPPFKTFIKEGGEAIMLNSGELGGEAVHASYNLVTKLLRDELGFKGVVITDWDDINKLYKYHKVAENAKQATLKAINAGIDITMAPLTLDFGYYVTELIEEGQIPIERIDLSVARILRMKFKMGLFEHPFPNKDKISIIGNLQHQVKAIEATRESVVLLKNKGVLPLDQGKRILIAGKNATLKRSLTGAWTYRWLPNNDSIYPESMLTFYESMKMEFGKQNVVLSTKESFKTDVKNVDAVILALGEMPHAEGFGNISNFNLPVEQQELVDLAIASGKPVVLVMIAARPLIATVAYDNADAFIWAGLPGIYGGSVLAEIISGKTNPSGRLPFSYPAVCGHYYNYNRKPSHENYDIPPQDGGRVLLAEFGDGESYSKFQYSNLLLSDSIIHEGDTITAMVTVTNSGVFEGKESVLWFITDEVASITRPVRALKHFDKMEIKAGHSQTFQFKIDVDDLSFVNADGCGMLEPGCFSLSVGNLNARFRLKLVQ